MTLQSSCKNLPMSLKEKGWIKARKKRKGWMKAVRVFAGTSMSFGSSLPFPGAEFHLVISWATFNHLSQLLMIAIVSHFQRSTQLPKISAYTMVIYYQSWTLIYLDKPSPTEKFIEICIYEKVLNPYKFQMSKFVSSQLIYTVWYTSSYLPRQRSHLIWNNSR